ncbi:MAG: hypothetical protein LBG61_00320 [Burkholderiales bacterium]|jgi:hypothetical protein|nr:hypothetical protein [Burkholderiales bacterium]
MKSLKRRTILFLALFSAMVAGGCASLTSDDPRSSYRSELWWLGSSNTTQASWPAAEVTDLRPMPVESIPDRAFSGGANERTPNWPPIIEPPEKQ